MDMVLRTPVEVFKTQTSYQQFWTAYSAIDGIMQLNNVMGRTVCALSRRLLRMCSSFPLPNRVQRELEGLITSRQRSLSHYIGCTKIAFLFWYQA